MEQYKKQFKEGYDPSMELSMTLSKIEKMIKTGMFKDDLDENGDSGLITLLMEIDDVVGTRHPFYKTVEALVDKMHRNNDMISKQIGMAIQKHKGQI